MTRPAFFALSLVVILASARASAEVSSPEVEARALAWRALELEAQGRCREAVPLFRKAYGLVPAPTLALFEGRCLERMRQLVEAEARYTAAASFQPQDSSPPPLARAASEAGRRLVALRPRVPRIIIEGRGPSQQVWIDGRETHGSSLAVNPGGHDIAWGSPRRNRHVELGEGEQQRLNLEDSPSKRDLAMYAALGVGALGIGTGVVTGLMASERSPSSKAYRTLWRISTWSYASGAVGLGVGGGLFVTRSNEREAIVVARGTF